MIPRDFECIRCGYNLRALPAEAGCPECRAPIAGSMCRFAEPARTASALRMAAWAFPISFLTLVPLSADPSLRLQIWLNPAGMTLLAVAAHSLYRNCRLERLSGLEGPLRRCRTAAWVGWAVDLLTAVLVVLANEQRASFTAAALAVFAMPAILSIRAWLFLTVCRRLAQRADVPALGRVFLAGEIFWAACTAAGLGIAGAIAAVAGKWVYTNRATFNNPVFQEWSTYLLMAAVAFPATAIIVQFFFTRHLARLTIRRAGWETAKPPADTFVATNETRAAAPGSLGQT